MQLAEYLRLSTGPLPEKMHQSDATGLALLKNGSFAADLIRFPPGGKVDLHTHPGSHMLFCVSGKGRVQYEDELHDLHPGSCYLIEDEVPHAIFADSHSELTLVAIADDHRPIASEQRLDMSNGSV